MFNNCTLNALKLQSSLILIGYPNLRTLVELLIVNESISVTYILSRIMTVRTAQSGQYHELAWFLNVCWDLKRTTYAAGLRYDQARKL